MQRTLLTIVLLLAIPLWVAAKTVDLEVYRDWRGNECNFKSSRPFFTISDVYELEHFWEKANIDESMPAIDFDKYMLLVWNPGPTMFDYDPVKLDRFIYKDGSFIALYEFERKDSGGYWRRPFVATLLPRVRKGDIFIMRKVNVAHGHVKWQHLYTLWDMSPGRNMPFEVVEIDDDTQNNKPRFVTNAKDADLGAIFEQPASEKPMAETTTEAVVANRQTVPVGDRPVSGTVSQQVSRPVARPAAESVSRKTNVAAKKDEKKKDDDFFGEFDTPASKPAARKVDAKPEAKPVGADEDPLFGEEFDINF
ncbi:MAG: hypothetical protein Kow0029_15580 [Candidatus Rifleibacteriota bacterium]